MHIYALSICCIILWAFLSLLLSEKSDYFHLEDYLLKSLHLHHHFRTIQNRHKIDTDGITLSELLPCIFNWMILKPFWWFPDEVTSVLEIKFQRYVFSKFYKNTSGILCRSSTGGSPWVPLDDRILMCMWYMASMDLYLAIAFFVCMGIIVPRENFSLIWRHQHYHLRAANFDLWMALMAIEHYSFLQCHTYCDTRHPFIMVISEDPWHSHLLPSV